MPLQRAKTHLHLRFRLLYLFGFFGACLLVLFLFAALRDPVHAYDASAFVMKIKTDNPGTSADTEFTIPITGIGYSYNVDCDDDGVNEVTAHTTSYTCTYVSPGTYTVAITGTFPRIYFNNGGDRQKLLEVAQWGTNAWTSMERAFYGASNLQLTATDAPNLSGVTNMSNMFRSASAFNGDLSAWDTGNVTDMRNMFYNASAFTSELSSWDTSNVTNMSYMFSNAYAFNGDVSTWDTGSATNMSSMFQSATAFNGDLSTWDTSNVTNMSYMFSGATTFNGDLSAWDTGNVTDMRLMFYNASAFTSELSTWDTSNVTNMSYMFSGASAFNGDVSTWSTSNVTNMSYMFRSATTFNSDVSDWDISNVTNMTDMFRYITLPYKTYDAILASWSQQEVQPNVSFHAGNSKYTNTEAKSILTSAPNNWTITDGGSPAPTITSPTTDATLVTNTPTITGTAVPDARVDITIGTQALTATADTAGNWSVTTDPLADGTYTITARVGDSTVVTVAGVTLVSPAPTITSPTTGATLVTNTLTITGTAVPGATVDVTIAGQELTATADENGDWSVTTDPIADGTYSVTAQVASSEVATVSITIKLPAAPVQPDKQPSLPEKSSNNQTTNRVKLPTATIEPDGTVAMLTPTLTVDGDKPIDQSPTIPSRPTFSGVATPGAKIEVSIADSICTATADESGNWECTLSEELKEGRYTISTVIINPDGSVVELDAYTAEVLGVKTSLPDESGGEDSLDTAQQEQDKSSSLAGWLVIVVSGLLVVSVIAVLLRRRSNSVTP